MLGFYLGLVAILLWWFLVLVPDAWLSALCLYVLSPLIALLAFMQLIEAESRLGQ